MEESAFKREVREYAGKLNKVIETLDISHISGEGMEETTEVGIPFNKALSFIEAANELVKQAQQNLNSAVSASK
jgi:hypothetical protein